MAKVPDPPNPNRVKRSISLPASIDEAVEAAATLEGTSVSSWIAAAVAARLGIEAGWLGIEEWEADNGRLTAEERADGRRRAEASLAGQRSRTPEEQAAWEARWSPLIYGEP